MGDNGFGLNVHIEEHIRDVVGVSKRLLSTDVQILLRERYERSHGIYSHAQPNDHFAHVRHHWCEDPIVASRLRERMEAFVRFKVNQHFGLSFKEFLEQPPYVCDLMFEVLNNRPASAESKEIDDLLKEMGKK